MEVVVIGAGAFGGWTAYHLRRAGLKVTLLDAWGAGHSRSSSGGETRIIRTVYGDDATSFRFSVRAMELWKQYELRWSQKLFHRCGALFLGHSHDQFLQSSKRMLEKHGIPVEELSPAEASYRYGQISFEGIDSVLFEPEAGYLTARRNCQIVAEQFIAEGGHFENAAARADGHKVKRVSDGSEIRADYFVFACGPWLPSLFPELLGPVIRTTRQDVFFVSAPMGDDRFHPASLPCWADRTSDARYYGIPDVENRGLKIASDLRGTPFDPDAKDRLPSIEAWSAAQHYLTRRFPALSPLRLTEARVCQYENTPDLRLIVDHHPLAPNMLLVGGGSGHGYKQGPAVGEHVAQIVLGQADTQPGLSLNRFNGASEVPSHSSF